MSKCQECGSKRFHVICWDGATSGGQTTFCAKCGKVTSESKYEEVE